MVHPERVELSVHAYKTRPQNRRGQGGYVCGTTALEERLVLVPSAPFITRRGLDVGGQYVLPNAPSKFVRGMVRVREASSLLTYP